MKVVNELEYVRGKMIGSGNFSEVFYADDPQLGGKFAVKEIPKTNFSMPDEYFAEAQRMKASECPNVVPIQFACANGTHVCLMMPLYKKGSLHDRINRDGPLSLGDIIRVGQDVLKGLNQIHNAGLLHLDVKPSNVLFSDTGAALVADFGQCRHIGPSGVTNAPDMYTRNWPPEVLLSGQVSVATDVFHAGLTLYRAVNGNVDFENQYAIIRGDRSRFSDAIVRGKFPNRESFRPDTPRKLKTVIRKALNIDPASRYASALAMADDLARVCPPLNWHVKLEPSGECRWRADRDKQRAIAVHLTGKGTTWSVSVFNVNCGKQRKKDETTLWRNGLSLKEAKTYLKTLFEKLE